MLSHFIMVRGDANTPTRLQRWPFANTLANQVLQLCWVVDECSSILLMGTKLANYIVWPEHLWACHELHTHGSHHCSKGKGLEMQERIWSELLPTQISSSTKLHCHCSETVHAGFVWLSLRRWHICRRSKPVWLHGNVKASQKHARTFQVSTDAMITSCSCAWILWL